MIKTSKEIVKELSREFGLPEYMVKNVESSMYSFLKAAFINLESVMLPYIGKFSTTYAKVKGDSGSDKEQSKWTRKASSDNKKKSMYGMSTQHKKDNVR